MIKLEKEQTARFAARLEQETQESVMRDIAQFSEADIVDTWASEPPACAEVHAMVFNMERGENGSCTTFRQTGGIYTERG